MNLSPPPPLSQVINFIYTGRIQIVTEKVESLLGVADMFDLQEVREACTDTLVRNLCPDNCISKLGVAGELRKGILAVAY